MDSTDNIKMNELFYLPIYQKIFLRATFVCMLYLSGLQCNYICIQLLKVVFQYVIPTLLKHTFQLFIICTFLSSKRHGV